MSLTGELSTPVTEKNKKGVHTSRMILLIYYRSSEIDTYISFMDKSTTTIFKMSRTVIQQ